MRIGIDASNLRSGGGLTHISEILQVAEPSVHGFQQIVVWGGKQTLKHLPYDKTWLKLVHDPLLDAPLPLRLYWRQVKFSSLAKPACDILWVPGGLYTGSFKPIVTMCRNMLPFEFQEMRRFGMSLQSIRYLLLRTGLLKSFRHADGVIFLTKYAQSVVMNINAIEAQSAIIHHGIDKQFCLPPRPQKPLCDYSPDNPFKLLYVSIVNFYKHQWHVAKAVANLRNEGIPITLDLIGPAYPPALRHLHKLIEQIDPKNEFIHYYGQVPYKELAKWYHRADAFVFASSCENMPNILMEAMAAGLPIACAQRGPMPEILGNAGVYFDPEQPTEIADTIRSLLEDQTLRQHYASAAFQYAQSYSWERCASETFSFLSKIAAQADNPKPQNR
jgi:glycosyltransferase involved in cell wall biosynthesis